MNKKLLLGLITTTAVVLLCRCTIDPTDISNLVTSFQANGAEIVGINESDIAGFENENGSNPTQVSVTFSDAEAALAANCVFELADSSSSTSLTNEPTTSGVASYPNMDSLFAALMCGLATSGTYTATANVTFQANTGIYYKANVPLTATVT